MTKTDSRIEAPVGPDVGVILAPLSDKGRSVDTKLQTRAWKVNVVKGLARERSLICRFETA